MKESIKNRYEFAIIFDVENGNPNGDPDAGGMPRIDPETNLGIVTDVCLKRKIRSYIEMVKEDRDGYRIYIKNGVPLNRSDNEAFKTVGIENAATMSSDDLKKEIKNSKKDIDTIIKDYMVNQYYDIRTFGAVMTTMMKGNLNCGQIRGPVQLGFARSIDPIIPQDITITRVTITTETDAEKKKTEIGNKYIVPYGLYICEGYISANIAKRVTGFSEDDLELLWSAIQNMFEDDRSAMRGKMAVRKLIIFKHDSELGNAPAHKLFDLISIYKKNEVDVPRSFDDYCIDVDLDRLPAGVNCEIRD